MRIMLNFANIVEPQDSSSKMVQPINTGVGFYPKGVDTPEVAGSVTYETCEIGAIYCVYTDIGSKGDVGQPADRTGRATPAENRRSGVIFEVRVRCLR